MSMSGEDHGQGVRSSEAARLGWRVALPQLHAAGLLLRELGDEDAPALARLACAQIAWPISAMVPTSVPEAGRFVASVRIDRAAGGSLVYAVFAAGDDTLAGLVRFRRLDAGFRMADGSFVFHDGAWDSSLAVGCLRLAIDFAFQHLGLHRLEVRTMAAREAALMKDLGATLEGRLRESWLVGDRLVDQNQWSILGSEWTSAPQGPSYIRPGPEPDVSQPVREPPESDEGDDSSPLWARTSPEGRRGTVSVREIRADDAAVLLSLFTPEELQVCIDPPTTTMEAFQRYIAWAQSSRAAGRAVAFVILTDDHPGPVGLVQVRQIERRTAVAEMGILLARACRGTGLFPAAARLVLDFTFQTMGVHRLEARTSGANHAGEASLRKLGAVREAHLRASFPRGDGFEDDDLWAILAPDWRRVRALGQHAPSVP